MFLCPKFVSQVCIRLPNLKLKAQHVNGDVIFPGIVLHCPCEEGLGEEEARQPEHMRLTAVEPILVGRGRGRGKQKTEL